MTRHDPTAMPDWEQNPFAAPTADLVPPPLEMSGDLAQAEITRREYLGREASIKSLGSLYYLGGIFGLIGCVGIGFSALNRGGPAGLSAMLILVGVIYLVMAVLNLALGYGLQHLQVWARWTSVVLIGLLLLYVLLAAGIATLSNAAAGLAVLLIAGGITGYMLYLLVSPKASVVFSAQYKRIILMTPHVKYKTSRLLLVLVLVVAVLILVAIIGAMLSR